MRLSVKSGILRYRKRSRFQSNLWLWSLFGGWFKGNCRKWAGTIAKSALLNFGRFQNHTVIDASQFFNSKRNRNIRVNKRTKTFCYGTVDNFDLLPDLNKYKLDSVAKALNISLENHHRAVDDANATAEIFLKFVAILEDKAVLTLAQLNELNKLSADAVKKLPTYHAIILGKIDSNIHLCSFSSHKSNIKSSIVRY